MEMEKSKLIPNSTQVPNIINDFLIPQLPEAEARCMLYICRRTYGFHKEEDRISFTQFMGGIKSKDGNVLDLGTGLARASVSEATKNLASSGAILVRADSKGNYYQINLDMDVDKVVQQVNQFREQTRSGRASRPKQVRLLNLQKKGKDRETKIGEQSSPITILRKHFTERCKEIRGFEPEMAFAKEGRMLKEKLQRYSVERLTDLINKFVGSRAADELGCTLAICLSAGIINQWLAGKLERKQKPYYRGNQMCQMRGRWMVSENGEWLEFAGKQSEIEWR